MYPNQLRCYSKQKGLIHYIEYIVSDKKVCYFCPLCDIKISFSAYKKLSAINFNIPFPWCKNKPCFLYKVNYVIRKNSLLLYLKYLFASYCCTNHEKYYINLMEKSTREIMFQ